MHDIQSVTISDPLDNTQQTFTFGSKDSLMEFLRKADELFHRNKKQGNFLDASGRSKYVIQQRVVYDSAEEAVNVLRENVKRKALDRLGEAGRIALDLDASDKTAA
jgi:hypothetical protein